MTSGGFVYDVGRSMSTNAPASTQEGAGQPPSQQDIMAIAAAAAAAADEAKSQAANVQAMVEAAQAEASKRSVDLPEPVIKTIATQAAEATVGLMRQIGAIRGEDAPDPTQPPPAAPGIPATAPPAPGAPVAQPPADPPADAAKPKKTLAERICDVVIKS